MPKTTTTTLEPTPRQPVERPILCSPYAEPTAHWVYADNGQPYRQEGRRPASYYWRTQTAGTGTGQGALFAEEQSEELLQVNKLRKDVARWRKDGYEGATRVTRELLAHWSDEHRARRFFFCQLEAVETIIFLSEIRALDASGKRRGPRFRPEFADDDFAHLRDLPNEPHLPPLTRYGCKMATGSGKTVVMAMLIAWSFCNSAQVPSDARFASAALVCCPNLTVKDRLGVLRPERPDNYYAAFDIVPARLQPLLQTGKVLVENWHSFAEEGEHVEGGKSYAVVNKGPESEAAFARRVLGDLYARAPILVLNDEAHHAYRPAPFAEDIDEIPGEAMAASSDGYASDAGDNPNLDFDAVVAEIAKKPGKKRSPAVRLTAAQIASLQEATIWVQGLDRINAACGIRFCVDLSATPFYLQGSGHIEGSPFPWLVSDFGLVDAIESGIVKIPRLPVADSTGSADPQYFRLWRTIQQRLKIADGAATKPKPQDVWREAEAALTTLASQWKQRYDQIAESSPNQDKSPPVMIVVCDNTDIAELFFEKISGQREEDAAAAGAALGDAVGDADAEDDLDPDPETSGADDAAAVASDGARKKAKPKKTIVYGSGQLFPDLLSNSAAAPLSTVRIDSKLLAEAEAEAESGASAKGAGKAEAAQKLREIIATVGKRSAPGADVRCVVSVSMLTEGWDASNVTQILGLRPFESQLLCEQVVGRGLRRMDYAVDPDTGLLTEEYVDVYGIPFSLIPFKGRVSDAPQPEDKPKNHVFALEERGRYEIRFPIVESLAFALARNQIKADVDSIEVTAIETNVDPEAILVEPAVGYKSGGPSLTGTLLPKQHTRRQYYDSTHLQQIAFEIARDILDRLTQAGSGGGAVQLPKLAQRARHQLFPQVLQVVLRYIDRRVDFRGLTGERRRELGLEKYAGRIADLLTVAIEPDGAAGEAPLVPVLDRYRPFGSTAEVDFKTTRPCRGAARSHINQVVVDSTGWEGSAAYWLESCALGDDDDDDAIVDCYARNDHLGFEIAYEFDGKPHKYVPDFLVRLKNGKMVILEMKGLENEQAKAKHQAARRWASAVTNAKTLGVWKLHVCRDPALLKAELSAIARNEPAPLPPQHTELELQPPS